MDFGELNSHRSIVFIKTICYCWLEKFLCKMYRFLKYFGSIVLAVLILAVIAPIFISLEKYKETIRNEVKNSTGLEISIDGNIDLAILPSPKVSVTQINIKNPVNNKKEDLLALDKLTVYLSMAEIIRGNLGVAAVELKKPIINIDEDLKHYLNNMPAGPKNDTSSNKQKKFTLPILLGKIMIKSGQLNYWQGEEQKTLELSYTKLNFLSKTGPIEYTSYLNYLDYDFKALGTVTQLESGLKIISDTYFMGHKLHIDGHYNLGSKVFDGRLEANGELKHIVSGKMRKLLDKYKLVADINTDKQQVALKNIDLNIGESLKASGGLMHNIADNQSVAEINLQPGTVKANIKLKSVFDALSGGFAIKVAQLDQLVEYFDIDNLVISGLADKAMSFAGDISYKKNKLELVNLNLHSADMKLHGNLAADFGDNETKYDYRFFTTSGNNILKNFSSTIPVDIGSMSFHGASTVIGKKINTNNELATKNSQTKIYGQVDLSRLGNSDLRIKSVSEIGKSQNNTIKSWNIDGSITGNFSKEIDINIDGSTVQIGREKSILSGVAAVNMSEDKPKVSVNLNLSYLDLSILDSSKKHQVRPQKTSSALNMDFLNKFNADLIVNFGKLKYGLLVFKNLKIVTKINDGVCLLDEFKGDFYDGMILGNGSISARDDQPLAFNIAVKDVAIDHNQEGVNGLTNFTAHLTSHTQNGKQHIDNLSGDLNLTMENGVLRMGEIQKILLAVVNSTNFSKILSNVRLPFSNKGVKFDKLNVEGKINNGIMTLNNSYLKADNCVMDLSGQVNFPKDNTLALLKIAIGSGKILPIKVKISGQIGNLQYSADKLSVVGSLVNNTLKNIGKTAKDPGEFVKGVLGSILN